MPGRRGAHHEREDAGKDDSSYTQVGFYDTTSYFRSYFTSVAKDMTDKGKAGGLKLHFKSGYGPRAQQHWH
jgi:hypothetical protein